MTAMQGHILFSSAYSSVFAAPCPKPAGFLEQTGGGAKGGPAWRSPNGITTLGGAVVGH